MLFERFLRKKRQDPIPQETQDALAERARSHEDPAARRDAARRLTGFTDLRGILTADADAGVREVAIARYRHLLCASDPPEPSLEARLAEVALIEDARVLEQVAVQATAPEVRRAAIERVASPEVLALCAVEDPLAANRGAAVERLDDKALLEQVVRRIGKRDKNVYRSAREKLRLIAEQEERPRRIRALGEELCDKVERLGRLEHWSQDRALLDHFDQQWSGLRDEADEEIRRRYEAGRARFLQAYGGHTRETAARIAAEEAHESLHAERLALLESLAEAATLGSEQDIRAHCARIEAAWNALEALPPPRQRPLDQRYHQLTAAAERAVAILAEERKRQARLRKASTKARQWIEEPKALDLRAAKTFLEQSRLLAAELPDSPDTPGFLELIDRLEARIKTQHKNAEHRLKQLPDKLAELEEHLAQGELKKADPLFQSLRAGLDLIEASALPKGAAEPIAARLNQLAPQLRDLQHWRRWGAEQHRRGLCEELEQLAGSDLSIEALSERLHVLRQDWRGLEQLGPRATQEIKERFHAAAEVLHERCRPFLEAQAAEREANRTARESVCEQIESFLAQVDWERVDWKRLLRAERETRQTWAAIGPVEPRHVRGLEGRFRQALKQLDQRLDAERKRNQAMKRDLIRQIEALAEESDLDRAIERTKLLQRQWHTTVPARHKDENKLWQTFRAACDAVFERRAAAHQAHANELKEHLATRESICSEALALAQSEDDPERIAAALHLLESRWDDAQSLPIPRHNAGPSNERWRTTHAAVTERLRAGEDRRRRRAFELLRQQAAVCERFERDLLGESETPATAETTEAAEAAWNELPEQDDGRIQQAIAARFASAVAAAREPARLDALRERYRTNAERLSRICLQLEILAGVETPRELAKQRLEFQVARLTERMVDGEEDPLSGSARLLTEWYLCGPPPRGAGLEERFERILGALEARDIEAPA